VDFLAATLKLSLSNNYLDRISQLVMLLQTALASSNLSQLLKINHFKVFYNNQQQAYLIKIKYSNNHKIRSTNQTKATNLDSTT